MFTVPIYTAVNFSPIKENITIKRIRSFKFALDSRWSSRKTNFQHSTASSQWIRRANAKLTLSRSRSLSFQYFIDKKPKLQEAWKKCTTPCGVRNLIMKQVGALRKTRKPHLNKTLETASNTKGTFWFFFCCNAKNTVKTIWYLKNITGIPKKSQLEGRKSKLAGWIRASTMRNIIKLDPTRKLKIGKSL